MTACYSPKVLTEGNFHSTSTPADSIVAQIPADYADLSTLKGEGKAIVSEPNNSSHISIDFSSTRTKSLLTIQNSLGIKGGKILSTPDSLVIYNRIDDYVRIVPVGDGRYSRINNLASVNLVEILTIPVALDEAKAVYENEQMYQLVLPDEMKVYVNKKTFTVHQIDRVARANAPWSRIVYEAYVKINGFSIPRRITIFSADGSSRVSLLIEALKIDPTLGELTLKWPDDIKIYRK